MAKYSGSEVVAEYLIKLGVPYVVGVIGHGCLCLADALVDRQDKIKFIGVKHEQCATHLADGYARATGKPLAVFTSVGPGAFNTLMGIAAAFYDSIPMLVFTGEGQTYIFSKSVFQTLDRKHPADFPSVTRPITKGTWQVTNIKQLPDILRVAFRTAVTGRPGPVHIDIPMDMQAEMIDTEIPDSSVFNSPLRPGPDPDKIEKIAKLIMEAKRPAILAGGGVISSEATKELIELAEWIGAPALTSFSGKGSIPEDHPLCCFYTGFKGSHCGTEIAKKADVLLALGYRFAEWSASSYAPDVSFNIPPSKVIQVDIDPGEIGRNYPVNIGIYADIKLTLANLNQVLRSRMKKRDYIHSEYYEEIQSLKKKWETALKQLAEDESIPMTTSRFLKELREFLSRDAIVTAGAGYSQMQVFHEFPIYEPRTHISSGDFAPMGFSIPAALGAKLAFPDRQVVAIAGEGAFLMTCQELATAVQYNIPIVCCVLNNFGWISIRDLQLNHLGRWIGTEFVRTDTGELYNPDFVKMGEAFGVYSERVEDPKDMKAALRRAFEAGQPALLEVLTDRSAHDYSKSGGVSLGWADTPVPKLNSRKGGADLG